MEKILWSEVGTKREYEVEYGNKPLGEFVREIVGLDMTAAKEAFSAYLNDANLQPLQLVLRSILVQNTPQPGMIADIQSTAEMAKVAELLKYATIVVSSLPLLIMYPFFQKYFDKGIMVGSVKG